MYRVIVERSAEKDLKRLSSDAAEQGINETAALEKGMEEKSKGFVDKGAEVYARV